METNNDSLVIYSAEDKESECCGMSLKFKLLKSNHGDNGKLSLPFEGCYLFDKKREVKYMILKVNIKIPYGHEVEIKPMNMSDKCSIKQNQPYFLEFN